jgi:NADPH:quinone reductase-like Zn-dependent oxidoreductase
MKAITQDRYGSADVLRLRDLDEPTPGEREVLVSVRAAGIARGVLHVMTGEPYLMRLVGFGLLRPKNPVLGQDVAGTVTATGDGVTRFDVGDEVFGIAKGSFAEYAVAREDKLSHKPENLSFAQAAAMPISGLTALGALDTAGVTAGSNVLIVGASGGVGTYAVQIAVALGATVTGVASGSKADLVAELGAQRVIDYTREDFADGSHTYDVIVDTGGMTSVSRLRAALEPKGTLVIVGGESGSTWSPGYGPPAEGRRHVTDRLAAVDVDPGQGALLGARSSREARRHGRRRTSRRTVVHPRRGPRRSPPPRGGQGPRPSRDHPLSRSRATRPRPMFLHGRGDSRTQVASSGNDLAVAVGHTAAAGSLLAGERGCVRCSVHSA